MDIVPWAGAGPADVADLWRQAGGQEALSEQELATALDGCRLLAAVSDDDIAAVVAYAQGTGDVRHRSNIRLLAVAPYHRRRGVGRALLTAAESRLRERGVTAIRLAAGVPRYLWPGIDRTNHGARALAMSAGYRLVDEAVNMSLATTFRAATPGAVTVSRVNGTGIAAVRAFVTVTWPLWGTEVDLAAARGSLFAAWDGARPVAFIAHSTMRAGWIGPMGTDDGFRGHGVGQALLSAACADLAADGWPRADIAWVGPVEYFARLGAHVNRRFLRYVKEWP